MIKNTLKLNKPTILSRHNNIIVANTEEELKKIQLKDALYLLKLTCDNTTFYISKNFEIKNCDEIPWISLRNFKNEKNKPGYKITIGDILKFGRIKLRVRTIKTEDEPQAISEINYTLDPSSQQKIKQTQSMFKL